MRGDYERDRKDPFETVDHLLKLYDRMDELLAKIRPVKVYESPWPDNESDRAARCQSCGQLLGKRCRRDGCGKQAKP